MTKPENKDAGGLAKQSHGKSRKVKADEKSTFVNPIAGGKEALILEETSSSHLDFNQALLAELEKDKSKAEIQLSLDLLAPEMRITASEVINASKDNNFEISDKFKLEDISFANIDLLIDRTQNLSIALRAFSAHKNARALRLIKTKAASSFTEFQKFSKLASKQYLVSRFVFPHLAEEIVASAAFKKSESIVKIQAAAYFARNEVDPGKILSSLVNITNQFNEQDDNYQLEIFSSLRKLRIEAAFQFLSHIDSDRLRYQLCAHITENLEVSEIVRFFTWENPDIGFGKIGIFKRIIQPYIENFMKWNHNLEDLLLLWPYLSNPENGLDIAQLKIKFKLLISKNGHLQESLRDEAVPALQAKLQETKDSLEMLKKEFEEVNAKLSLSVESKAKLEIEIDEIRASKKENTLDALNAQESIERQIKIDLLRSLLPTFERALSGESAPEISKLLEEQKIEMVGVLNQKIRWNQTICESLTGLEISEGIVVKTGFTWFTGKEVVPLRRMLLKPE
ncbi:Alpha_kinase domain containing protein [Candidatus Nanopelagicaceae bacterium]